MLKAFIEHVFNLKSHLRNILKWDTGVFVCLVSSHAYSTSTGICKFCAPQETEISRSSPNRLCVTETQSGAEVVSMQRLFTINRIVSSGIMGAAHPDLFLNTVPSAHYT